MDCLADQSAQNLKTLSTLKSNQKLITTHVIWGIQEVSMLGGLYRRWFGEDRITNISRVSETIKNTIIKCKLLAYTDDHAFEYKRLMQTLKESIMGLKVLLNTYRDDISICSQINIIIENVENFVDSYSSYQENFEADPSN